MQRPRLGEKLESDRTQPPAQPGLRHSWVSRSAGRCRPWDTDHMLFDKHVPAAVICRVHQPHRDTLVSTLGARTGTGVGRGRGQRVPALPALQPRPPLGLCSRFATDTGGILGCLHFQLQQDEWAQLSCPQTGDMWAGICGAGLHRNPNTLPRRSRPAALRSPPEHAAVCTDSWRIVTRHPNIFTYNRESHKNMRLSSILLFGRGRGNLGREPSLL